MKFIKIILLPMLALTLLSGCVETLDVEPTVYEPGYSNGPYCHNECVNLRTNCERVCQTERGPFGPTHCSNVCTPKYNECFTNCGGRVVPYVDERVIYNGPVERVWYHEPHGWYRHHRY